jgi:hypothetical protein
MIKIKYLMPRHIPAYGVFIIESMDWDNEAKGKLDGYALKTILDLSDIPNQYIYIRTYQEFEHAMELFKETDYGFLHISCHGNEEGICLTMDDLSFEDLGLIMGPYLKYRRLFLSACKAASFALAEYFIPRYHCYSIMGAADTIDYDKAAIFWSSYYYLMYRDDQKRMWQKNIIPTLQNITRTFDESLNYFSIINERNPKSKFSLREIHFQNGSIKSDQVKATRFENLYWDEAIAEPDRQEDLLQHFSSPVS